MQHFIIFNSNVFFFTLNCINEPKCFILLSESPSTTPKKLKNSINYRALIGIAALVISFHMVVSYGILQENSEILVSIFSFLNPLLVTIVGFSTYFRYRGSLIFGKSHLFLSFAFLSLFLAELTYMIYEQFLGLDPYPSIADVFFFALYPLLILYLVKNIRYFSPNLDAKSKSFIILMPIVLLAGYSTLSTTVGGLSIFEFDFLYGSSFIYVAALALSFSIVGTIKVKQGLIGPVWLLIMIGIVLNNIGDVWYYNLELFEAYDLFHPVNLFWYSGYWIILYALLKQKKTI